MRHARLPLVDDGLEDARTVAGGQEKAREQRSVEYPNSVHKSRWHTHPPFEIRMATIFTELPSVSGFRTTLRASRLSLSAM